MRHFLVLLLLFTSFFSFTAKAQSIQWASKILGVSSELKQDPVGEGFMGKQALGAPERVPGFGFSPCAWTPSEQARREDEWIKVGFASPQRVQQVVVAENWGAGTITQVILFNAAGDSAISYEDYANYPPEEAGRLFYIPVEDPGFLVAAVKVVMSTLDIEGYNQIDAIGLSDHKTRIDIQVETVEVDIEGAVEKLPFHVNSPYDEVLPVAMPDGSGLFFVRKNHPSNYGISKMLNDDIWYVEMEGGNWGLLRHLEGPLNDARNNYVASVAPDGNMLLLGNTYDAANQKMQGISYSERVPGGKWGYPKLIKMKNHYNWSKTEEFCLGPNREVIIFTVQRRTSEGKKDLYVSFRNGDSWSEPMHMGNEINSPDDEISPFLAADGRTLYFASRGFRGFGDYDLFVSRRLDSTWTKWSEPQNIGQPFNSPKADVSLSIDAFGKNAYFASAKHSNIGNNDIFRVALPASLRPEPVVLVKGTVYNQKDSLPIGAEIRYEQLSTGHALGSAKSNTESGRYSISLPLREAYAFFATSEGFMSVDDHIDLRLSEEKETYEIERDLYLVPLIVGQVIRLNNVFFVQSEAELLPSSFPELKRLAYTMQVHPNLKISLEGHTDIEGDPFKNMKLSKDRVRTVKEFLIQEGIEEWRLETHAYGATQPLSRSRTPAAKKANRRVEVRILEK